MHKEIGKITRAKFGLGGYQDCQVVFEFQLGGSGWGTCYTYECHWGHVSEEDLKKPDSNYKWTHEQRIESIGKQAWEVIKLMKSAKVDSLDKLNGLPIEATFEGPCGRILSFRILTEVI